MGLVIDGAVLWLAATNCYVVAAAPGEEAVIIDAPPGATALLDVLASHQLVPAAILLTHGHIDHVGGSGELADRCNVPAYLHPADVPLASNLEAQAAMIFGPEQADGGRFRIPEELHPLADGDVLEIGGMSLQILHTPGHTPGQACVYLPHRGVLFSGDHLFAGSIGRTDLPGGDYDTLLASLDRGIRPLPPETVVYPGHGPATTLAAEFASNPFLTER
jgi:glyoxylase-like metal-dependent hydrolase (beta-lactamase superfamily II)